MSNRMTNERLAEIGYKYLGIKNLTTAEAEVLELLAAMKAERESLNACAKANTDLRLRIEELEAQVKSIADDYLELKRLRKGEALHHLGDTKRIEKLKAKLDRVQTRLNHREGVMRDMQTTIGKQQDEYEKLEARYTKLGDEE